MDWAEANAARRRNAQEALKSAADIRARSQEGMQRSIFGAGQMLGDTLGRLGKQKQERELETGRQKHETGLEAGRFAQEKGLEFERSQADKRLETLRQRGAVDLAEREAATRHKYGMAEMERRHKYRVKEILTEGGGGSDAVQRRLDIYHAATSALADTWGIQYEDPEWREEHRKELLLAFQTQLRNLGATGEDERLLIEAFTATLMLRPGEGEGVDEEPEKVWERTPTLGEKIKQQFEEKMTPLEAATAQNIDKILKMIKDLKPKEQTQLQEYRSQMSQEVVTRGENRNLLVEIQRYIKNLQERREKKKATPADEFLQKLIAPWKQ